LCSRAFRRRALNRDPDAVRRLLEWMTLCSPRRSVYHGAGSDWVSSIPKLHRQILGKRWIEGMSFEDIASDLDVTVDCARGVARRSSPELLILLRQVGLGPK
jgi:hypothetical protein